MPGRSCGIRRSEVSLVGNRQEWRTVAGGSQENVRKLVVLPARPTPSSYGRLLDHTDGERRGVREASGREPLRSRDHGGSRRSEPPDVERRVRSGASDPRWFHLLPECRRAASRPRVDAQPPDPLGRLELLTSDAVAESRPVAHTYWMNRLQSIDKRLPTFVSLNPFRPPDQRLVEGTFLRTPDTRRRDGQGAGGTRPHPGGESYLVLRVLLRARRVARRRVENGPHVARTFGVDLPW